MEVATNICLLTHKDPDGDAVGSLLGMHHLLKALGKDSRMVIPNEIPAFLMWMPGADRILVHSQTDEARQALKQADLIIMLDFNHPGRVAPLDSILPKLKARTMLIDHHPEPAAIAELTLSDPTAGANAEIICQLAEKLLGDKAMSPGMATCLYAGMMTDTGNFSYNASSPGLFRTLARLLETGIDKNHIYDRVYNTFSAKRMQLMGHCLKENLRVYKEYHTAIIYIRKADKDAYEFQPGDSEGFVNLPLSISGVRFSILLTEKGAQYTKLSLRSKGRFAANRFAAEHFNGGGHLNAAGGYAERGLEETIKEIETLLPKWKKELQSE